jgi:hypothetical protein
MSEPLSEEQIVTIRMFHAAFAQALGRDSQDVPGGLLQFVAYTGMLLADRDHWRVKIREMADIVRKHVRSGRIIYAEVKALRKENAAMRPIIEVVANTLDGDYDEECPFCKSMPGYTPIEHKPDCSVAQARVLLAKKRGTQV